jgi:DNA-binding transcriptional MerR regulator
MKIYSFLVGPGIYSLALSLNLLITSPSVVLYDFYKEQEVTEVEMLAQMNVALKALDDLEFKNMHIELSKDKLYFSIGELADAFGVNASLIRFWDKEFDILKPKKNAKGNRMFTQEDVKNLQLIYHLVKERGFTLEGAKTHLKEGQKKTLDKFDIISKLETIKAQLSTIKNQL